MAKQYCVQVISGIQKGVSIKTDGKKAPAILQAQMSENRESPECGALAMLDNLIISRP